MTETIDFNAPYCKNIQSAARGISNLAYLFAIDWNYSINEETTSVNAEEIRLMVCQFLLFSVRDRSRVPK
jgi:hypothetical protein